MLPKITAYDIAVLTKVNELASRYGLEPWEFDALYDCETGALTFPATPTDADKFDRFAKMLDALGCRDGALAFSDDADLIQALDGAIRTAPRARHI